MHRSGGGGSRAFTTTLICEYNTSTQMLSTDLGVVTHERSVAMVYGNEKGTRLTASGVVFLGVTLLPGTHREPRSPSEHRHAETAAPLSSDRCPGRGTRPHHSEYATLRVVRSRCTTPAPYAAAPRGALRRPGGRGLQLRIRAARGERLRPVAGRRGAGRCHACHDAAGGRRRNGGVRHAHGEAVAFDAGSGETV